MDKLIQNFSIKSISDFFKSKISSFQPISENLDYIIDDKQFDKFSALQKIGEVEFKNAEDLLVFACKFNGELSERASKKQQFEIAKKVLKEDFKDGSIFVFHDSKGCFRFSFIRRNYGNKEQKFSNWKRYTYFVDPLKTNKTFKNRINGCNFSSLDDIQEAFSVEKLNKKFYEEIATAFYSLIGGKVNINKKEVSFNSCLQLPSTPVDNRKVYQEFAVRLIGRTIFCWFLKNKKSDAGIPLIPEEWLSSSRVASVNNDQHNYYHSIVEKLFFLVLNKKQEDRKPYMLPNDHELVPFLNGGLFEAQEDDFFPKDSKGIHNQNFALNIPNDWFLKFFETLEQYNFTIDENSINDFEVSIDPEMLGTIFENLLAEIDPDTEKSARKSTGSFYTPREIVDYMVEQSLLQYIKTKTNIEDEEQLEILLKDDTENPFNEKQTIAILEALSEVKILDPACGSGAFPMGVLHKIIVLLKKLDKGAVWWRAKQLEKIDNALVRKAMEEKISKENSDYIRKLGVIQHSIYGVDIQPIAAEISKLRSFLSLIIDENIDDKAENRGIEPLPNLEFKFVTANTLVSLEKGNTLGKDMTFDFGETSHLQNELQQLRASYLQATPQEKENLKKKFEKLQTQIYKQEVLNAGGIGSKRAQQLVAWKPFSNESSAWFDPEWMFGVEKFDVVIGNPPYVQIKQIDAESKKRFTNSFKFATGRFNLFYLFIEITKKFSKENSITSYIVPDRLLLNTQCADIRKYLLTEQNINEIIAFGELVFESAIVDSIIITYSNSKRNKDFIKALTNCSIESLKSPKRTEIPYSHIDNSPNNQLDLNYNLEISNLINKIRNNCELYGNICNVKDGIIQSKIPDLLFLKDRKDEFSKKILFGRDIDSYKINWNNNWVNYNEVAMKSAEALRGGNGLRLRNSSLFENKKILTRQTSDSIIAAYDVDNFYYANTLHGAVIQDVSYDPLYLLGVLNSKLITFYYRTITAEEGKVFAQVKIELLKLLPIKKTKDQQKIIDIVNALINQIKIDDNNTNDNYIDQIDLLVYKLYELSYDEVLVVDAAFELSEQEYDNYKLS
ncbi:Type I restriction-modification system methyltransferase subunit [Flavobacterium cauense R2A-7]|uniref:site-specific DNA-methyltransferase (adenine-specific) n=1 Tax=Flavobacterium cauense R2A-7 TaxID=1341154 RepID=V6RXK5_9FLAO|nr:TaqI-like C-terminal specificity domain-containing protein [Flavobacterium cauense]ESU19178.1 Type I restriction-modification system methyltransferase subunit [Flavobacterium cauense R2A-7]KGO82197.1 hypothetical protein Q762_05775 [Flavobacterium cauense R2A-7]TWI15151.1 Eco57I restriction-modification methylase [Flavobacterium cauense R2A-7]